MAFLVKPETESKDKGNSVVRYIRGKIGVKLFLCFSSALIACIISVGFLSNYLSDDFRKLVFLKNEEHIKEQALTFLSETTNLQAQKYEAVFQKLEAYSRSNARQMELLLKLNRVPDGVILDNLSPLTPNPLSGILFNDLSSPIMVNYWGGQTITPQLEHTVNLQLLMLKAFEESTKKNPEVVASHLIMSEAYGAYYPNGEHVHMLPPVSELDLRNTNNYVLANPINNPDKNTVWVPVYFDDAGMGLMTTVSTPIYGEQDSFLGVAGLDITLDKIHNMVMSDKVIAKSLDSNDTVSFLLDRQGKFIFFPLEKSGTFGLEVPIDKFKNSFDLLNTGLADSSLPEIRLLGEEIVKSEKKTSRFSIGDINYISSFVLLKSTGWRLVTIVPEEIFIYPVKSVVTILEAKSKSLSKQFNLVAVLFLSLTLLLTVIFLRRYLLTPLQKITIASSQIMHGDFNTKLDISRTDEIGLLANTFNKMTKSLLKSRELEKNYSQELKLQVASKTFELEKDIQKRKEVEAELVLAKDKAEEANRAKSNFLANMTHELRTPLIGVLGMNELLLNTQLTEKQRRLADTVQSSGEILLNLISDILDFSKIESSNLALRQSPTNLSEIVEETTKLLAESASQKGLSLTWQISPEANCIVMADSLKIRQILLNLVNNAIKFTSRGEIVVRLEMSPIENYAGFYTLEVQDTGLGINTEDLKTIFEPFTQVDSTIARKAGGTGLGLAIVRHLVELMDGRIEVESSLGEGTLIRVLFTLLLADNQKDKAVSNEQIAYSLSKPSIDSVEQITVQHGKILIADDYAVTRELVRHHLMPFGFEIDEASSGHEALELTVRENYDLILMDCNMPNMDGIEAARQIREKGIAAPIIALTAHVDSRILNDCLKVGMNDCLSKPFRGAALKEIVTKWLTVKERKPLE